MGQAEFYVKKFDRMSGVLGDAGLSLIRLSKYEEEGGMELARYTQSMESVQAVSRDFYDDLKISMVV